MSREEHLLYLMHELDQVLGRDKPSWTPAQARIAERLLLGLSAKLDEMGLKLSRIRGDASEIRSIAASRHPHDQTGAASPQ